MVLIPAISSAWLADNTIYQENTRRSGFSREKRWFLPKQIRG